MPLSDKELDEVVSGLVNLHPKDAPAAPAEVPVSESIARGAKQGLTLGWGDELSAGLAAVAPVLDREATGDADNVVTLSPDQVVRNYVTARNFYRGKDAAAANANPVATLAGGLTGGVALASRLPYAGPSGVLSAAGQGFTSGVGESDDESGARLVGSGALGAVGALGAFGASRAVGAGLNRVGRYAAGKVGQATAKAGQQAADEAAAELKTLTGQLGGETQKGNRLVEWVIRLLDEEKSGALSAENKALLTKIRQDPKYGELLNQAAESVAAAIPAQAGVINAKRAALATAQESVGERVAARTGALLSPQTARQQVMDRVKRYGPPALGSAIGASIGGPLGVAVGALAGAGTRPMVHALKRMSQNPAVQRTAWSAIQKVLQVEPAKLGRYAPILGRALAGGGDLAAVKHFIMWENDPDYRQTVQDAVGEE